MAVFLHNMDPSPLICLLEHSQSALVSFALSVKVIIF